MQYVHRFPVVDESQVPAITRLFFEIRIKDTAHATTEPIEFTAIY